MDENQGNSGQIPEPMSTLNLEPSGTWIILSKKEDQLQIFVSNNLMGNKVAQLQQMMGLLTAALAATIDRLPIKESVIHIPNMIAPGIPGKPRG